MPSDYLKTVPQYILPKQLLTAFAGFMANIKNKPIKNYLIKRFIYKYAVNMEEAREENPEQYSCFNNFFIRHLKPECRPIANTDIVSPVDGYISEIGPITAGKLLQAKGRYYSVQELLACDETLYSQFNCGHFATLYLSPQDYHRVHMPMTGTLQQMIYIPGKLFSVQPTTARGIPKLFARNERLVVFFDTSIGPMAMVLVGATIVGKIGTSWQGDLQRSRKRVQVMYPQDNAMKTTLNKTEEMGYFKLGSTVVLLFANGQRVQWLQHLQAGDKIRFGEALGIVCTT